MAADDLDEVMSIEVCAYSHPWSRGNFVDSLAAQHDMRVLIDGDGRIAAYSVAMPGADEAHLLNLTVRSQHQRQGLARRLLGSVIDWCGARGFSALWLEVRTGNAAALALYRRCGFVQTGLRRAYYPAPNGREDAVLMNLAVAPASHAAPAAPQRSRVRSSAPAPSGALSPEIR